jgi:hypothetical protein
VDARGFKPALLPLEAAFDKRTTSLYSAMKQRFGERRFKSGPRKGVVFRHAMEIPFTLEEFRVFTLEALGGNKSGACLCFYCRAEPLDARNIGWDHEHPVNQGGSLALLNLKPCCQTCNRMKGKLTPMAFAWLKEILRSEIGKHFTIADSNDIRMRLMSGGMTFSTSAKKRLEKQKAAQPPEEPF